VLGNGWVLATVFLFSVHQPGSKHLKLVMAFAGCHSCGQGEAGECHNECKKPF
jgi:S-adenosylmethionine:tRNA-ribosyltransferase-isomerase (queuine synthetase)